MRKHLLLLTLLTVVLSNTFAQNLPKTNVFAFDFIRSGDAFALANGRFLTNFNGEGYNNQPHFLNNNEIYVTSQTPTGGQSDIWSLSFLTGIRAQVTNTAESEYSPTLAPDRRSFTCIRTDADAEKKQRLWRYPLDRSNAGQAVLKYHTMIGYHVWLSDTSVACFMLEGQSNYLAIVNVKDESSMRLEASIGRSLVKLPDGKLAYVAKGSSSETWFIKSLDPRTNETTFVIKTVSGSEDFVCLPDGTLLMTGGSKIFAFKIGSGATTWTQIADLKAYGIRNIKRLAVSREQDKIVIVNDMTVK